MATWRDDPSSVDRARIYYDEYIAAEARRHLSFLAGEVDAPNTMTNLPERIRWIASAAVGALVVEAQVVGGEVFSLASGALVRWAGSLDLTRLRDLTVEPVSSAWVAEHLRAGGLSATEAQSAIAWALAQGVIAPFSSKPFESIS